jgi:hypothetical protein
VAGIGQADLAAKPPDTRGDSLIVRGYHYLPGAALDGTLMHMLNHRFPGDVEQRFTRQPG